MFLLSVSPIVHPLSRADGFAVFVLFMLLWWDRSDIRVRVEKSVFSFFVSSSSFEGIQKCEHDHDYEHIRQSSALSVVREFTRQTSSNQPFPPHSSLSTTSTRIASYSHRLSAAALYPWNIGSAHPTPPHCICYSGMLLRA